MGNAAKTHPLPQVVLTLFVIKEVEVKRILYSIIVLSLLMSVACAQTPKGKGAGEVASTSDGAVKFRVETFVSGLQVPWSIVFVPDGRVFVTERPGRVRVIENGQLRPEPLATIADVEARSESGLMGLTLHPQFTEKGRLLISYNINAGASSDLLFADTYRPRFISLPIRGLRKNY